MKKIGHYLCVVGILLIFGCAPNPAQNVWESFDEQALIAQNQSHPLPRMQYKRILSKHRERGAIWQSLVSEIQAFGVENYERLKPFILEQNIPSLQQNRAKGVFSYEELTLFYLYRIYSIENDPERFVNAVIALSPYALATAKARDKQAKEVEPYSLYGIPVLLKDNINAAGMPTTAGAAALANNRTDDAFLTRKLKDAGAVILGKANLSEWAYYFCSGCPVGYSALGGQTLNPYGRYQFESGGSSSGSGVAAAMNYAAVTLGSETSGSILSPSAKNSVVGLKPTVGRLSRSGIIPISSSLDTAGPITKNVLDNWIVFNAIQGPDPTDAAALEGSLIPIPEQLPQDLKGKRIGYFKNFQTDTLYARAIQDLEALGAELVEFVPTEINLQGFAKLLDVDMKKDLPAYFQQHAATDNPFGSVADVVAFNHQDTLLHAPYGQTYFKGIVADTTSQESFQKLKQRLLSEGRRFFETAMQTEALDAVISIDNYTAAYAAVAHYPALAVPMGYKPTGEPSALVFIAPSQQEAVLYTLGSVYESATQYRQAPDFK